MFFYVLNISSPSSYLPLSSPLSPIGASVTGDEQTPARRQAIPQVEESKTSEGSKERPDLANKQADKEDQRNRLEQAQQLRDQEVITKLKARDREVRAHEAAHAAVGGQYAGAPTYTYQRGPNGVNYAVGGEVSISTSEIAGDPEATLQKAMQVQRAALAPAEPSAQDRKVAAQASQMAAQAKIDIASGMQTELAETRASAFEQTGANSAEVPAQDSVQGIGENEASRAAGQTEPSKANQKSETAAELTGLATPVVNVAQLLADAGLGKSIEPGRFIDSRA